MKCYAIKEGFDFKQNCPIKHKVVYSWDDCKKFTDHVPGAIFKKVGSEEEAYRYFGISKPVKHTYHQKKNGFPFHIYYSSMDVEKAMKSIEEPQFLCCLDSCSFTKNFKAALDTSSEVFFHVTIQSDPSVKEILSYCKNHQIKVKFDEDDEALPWD